VSAERERLIARLREWRRKAEGGEFEPPVYLDLMLPQVVAILDAIDEAAARQGDEIARLRAAIEAGRERWLRQMHEKHCECGLCLVFAVLEVKP
jgi:hypothetical protein